MWAAVAVESAISVVRARRGRRGATVVTEAVRAEDVLPALPKAIRAGACGEDTGGGEAERLGEVSGSALEGLVTAARGDRASNRTVVSRRATEVVARDRGVHSGHRDCARGSERVPSHGRGSSVVVLLASVLPIELPAPWRETDGVAPGHVHWQFRPHPCRGAHPRRRGSRGRRGGGAGPSRRGASALRSAGGTCGGPGARALPRSERLGEPAERHRAGDGHGTAAEPAATGIAQRPNSDIEADGFAAVRSCIVALLASPKATVIAAASSWRIGRPAA